MNKKIKWMVGLSIALIFISACSLLDNLNPLGDLTSQIEDLADELPIDDIQEQIEGLVTDLPGELDTLVTDLPAELDDITDNLENLTTDLPGDLNALATEIPFDVDDILDDLDGLVGDVFGSDDIPDDIPVIEGEIDDLIGTEKLITYMTSLDFNTVLTFYQEQMPLNGWTEKDGSVVNTETALLYFEKTDREATVTINFSSEENKTIVMIIIQD